MEPKVIFEDKYILAVDKPSGWITNEAQTVGGQPVLQSWLYKNFDYQIARDKEFRSGIVHRLDKETSGILLIAKTERSFHTLQDQFKKRIIEKRYAALAHGLVEPKRGVIKVPVGRLPWARKKFGIIAGGRDSETIYDMLIYYQREGDMFSYLELEPKTGRTHQIRIHLKYLGHPIVSDKTYAGHKTSRRDRLWCPRLFLHAKSISFSHPGTGKQLEVESGLPKDLKSVLALLEKRS